MPFLTLIISDSVPFWVLTLISFSMSTLISSIRASSTMSSSLNVACPLSTVPLLSIVCVSVVDATPLASSKFDVNSVLASLNINDCLAWTPYLFTYPAKSLLTLGLKVRIALATSALKIDKASWNSKASGPNCLNFCCTMVFI